MTLKGAQNVRFWGKISAIKSDYYVIEAGVEPAEAGELGPDVEAPGQPGINKAIYYVSTNSMMTLVSILCFK